jgi:hypothetical protein
MRVITTILMTFLLIGSTLAGAAHSKEAPLAKIVFYVS